MYNRNVSPVSTIELIINRHSNNFSKEINSFVFKGKIDLGNNITQFTHDISKLDAPKSSSLFARSSNKVHHYQSNLYTNVGGAPFPTAH